MDFEYPPGATPLNPDEIKGLIPTHITTRAELDRWEQDNINEALSWVEDHNPRDILNESFMKRLHKKMFCNVWKWAGTFRQSEKNIGVAWYNISIELKQLCDDVKCQIENRTFSEDEIAARFHHRLVSIHLFANGNGRHARLMADILLETMFHRRPFTWGSANLIKAGQDRKRYIESLIAADRGDYTALLKFVRSSVRIYLSETSRAPNFRYYPKEVVFVEPASNIVVLYLEARRGKDVGIDYLERARQ